MPTTTRRQVLQTVAGAFAATLVGAAWTRSASGQTPAAAPAAAPAPGPAPTGPYTLPPLPYAYDALEPHIDAETMHLHHDKHHATYVAKLNEAVAPYPELAAKPVEQLLREFASVPMPAQKAVRNHGGGHANHSLFWLTLAKNPAKAPSGALAQAVAAELGGLDALKATLSKEAAGLFGSGWAWVVVDPAKKLVIETAPNQDSPLLAGATPLFGIDVWEHAYYLKYKNKRADYVAAFWNVLNWDFVSERYAAAVKA